VTTRAALSGRAAPFVVVSGLSGAGKSHALRALEDLGYFCVDNLPIALIPSFASLVLKQRRRRRGAVVVDVRERDELTRFPAEYRRLKRQYGRRVRLVFFEAADSAIVRRFSETRRPHPLEAVASVAEGVANERRLLQPVRRLADQVVDTSHLTVHDLRRRVMESTGGTHRAAPLRVNLISFGFRHGLPGEADTVFDVRFLPNPHFVTSLRPWTGRHARVARYVLRDAAAKRFLSHTTRLLQFLLPQYIREGKTYLTIAIGCTGGRHRSVAIAEALGKRLRRLKGVDVQIRHRDEARSGG
jgi:UPF0042 nucleotide-binding protein